MHCFGLQIKGYEAWSRALVASRFVSGRAGSAFEGLWFRCRLSYRAQRAMRASMACTLRRCISVSVDPSLDSQVSRTTSARSWTSYWGERGDFTSSIAVDCPSIISVSALRKCRLRAFSKSWFRLLFFSRCKAASTSCFRCESGSLSGLYFAEPYLFCSLFVSALLSALSESKDLLLASLADISGVIAVGALGSAVKVINRANLWTASFDRRPRKAAIVLNRTSRSR